GTLGRNAVGIPPQRYAIGAPAKRKGPARQRLAGIPSALAIMEQAAGREPVAQPADQRIGQRPLVASQRGGMPFGAGTVIDRDKGRLAAHSEAHIRLIENLIDAVAQLLDL